MSSASPSRSRPFRTCSAFRTRRSSPMARRYLVDQTPAFPIGSRSAISIRRDAILVNYTHQRPTPYRATMRSSSARARAAL